MDNMIEIQIAAAPIRDLIPKDQPLRERVAFAMRYVRQHPDLFFMSPRVDDDLMMRTALAAVMLAGDATDREMIERSLKPMRMLSAAMSGIPVDFGALDTEVPLPLLGMWHESAEAEAGAEG